MGYHKNKIPKGMLGNHSKITEEYLEFMDSVEQDNPVMALIELSDMIGAIEWYVTQNYNIALKDLIKMKDATETTFNTGHRK